MPVVVWTSLLSTVTVYTVWWSWTPRGSSDSGLRSDLEMANGVITVVPDALAESV